LLIFEWEEKSAERLKNRSWKGRWDGRDTFAADENEIAETVAMIIF
jgi:hypothetical protein